MKIFVKLRCRGVKAIQNGISIEINGDIIVPTTSSMLENCRIMNTILYYLKLPKSTVQEIKSTSHYGTRLQSLINSAPRKNYTKVYGSQKIDIYARVDK